MTFDGSTDPSAFGTSIWDSHDVTFARNEITGYASAQGVLIRDRSTGVRLIANQIHDLGLRMRYDHGIYCQSARGTVIERNVIHDIRAGYGIHLFGDCDGTRIVGNTIAHNGLSGIIIAGNDDRGTADRTLIARNVIADHERAAWSEYGFAVTQYQPGRGNVVRDNVFFGNAARRNVDCDTCVERHNLVRDPHFVDPARGDYALRPGTAVRAMISGARRHRSHR
jgi:nitrous oxidase accessory protein NosD